MKYFKHILLLLLMLPLAVCAQQTVADSLYLFQQDKRQIDFFSKDATQLISSGIDKISQVGVQYTTLSGHFRTAQQAEDTKTAMFGTSGIATLGRFKLYGDFSFSRQFQDSLSWSLKGVADEVDPYYFGAVKAGSWQRINYSLNGVAAYRLPGNKFYIASGVNYFYNTAARSVDPRASVQTFRFLLTPELVYQSHRHTLGLSILWGYEHEDNVISYRNIMFSRGGDSYPDRILYRVFGYGSLESFGSKGTLRRRGTYAGTGVNYAYADSMKYLRIGVRYKENNIDELSPLSGSVNYDQYGVLYLKTYSAALLAGINSASYKHQFSADIAYTTGKDKNTMLNASSYKYRDVAATFIYSIQHRSISKNQFEFSAQMFLNDHSQRDLSVSHTINYTIVQPGVQAMLYHKYINASRLKIALAPALRLPVSSYLQVPQGEQNVVFNNTVTYPDYAFYTSTAGLLSGLAEYVTPKLFRGVYSSVSVNVLYTKPLKTGTVYNGAAFVPSGNTLQAVLRFNVYF